MRPSLVVSLLCALMALPAQSAEPWRAAPFTADPAQAVAAAKALPAVDSDSEILFERHERSFDAQGRELNRDYLWIHILQPTGVERWGTITESFQPWYQDRPVVRARVITADGKAHPLDPKTMGTAPASAGEEAVLTDAQALNVPLPAVSVGALIELETTLRDREPGFTSAALVHDYLQGRTPIRRLELSVEVAAPAPLKVLGEHLPSTPTPVRQGGATRWTFTQENVPAIGHLEDWIPAEDVPLEGVWISTGSHWSQVADAYAAIVDKQIAGGPVDAKALLGKAKLGREAAVEKALAWIQAQIRYTGIEFGEAAVVPRTPQETLTRRFGDCKDMATLLVALLRSEGVSAEVALLKANWGVVPSQLPGGAAFDHAIVHVPGKPELWVDPTSRYRTVGGLPGGDQGRPALIARRGEDQLVTLPTTTGAQNRMVLERDLYLPEEGPVRVIERRTSVGQPAADRRSRVLERKPDALAKEETDYAREQFGAAADRIDRQNLASLDRPFIEELEVKKAPFLSADPESVSVPLRIASVFSLLPDALTSPPEGDAPHRKYPLAYPTTTSVELRYRIHPAPEFVAERLPADETLALGPARLTRHYERSSDGTLLAAASFDPGPSRYSAADVEAFWAARKKWGDSPIVNLALRHAGRIALDQGHPAEALAAYQRSAVLHPQEPLHHLQLAQTLLDLGFGEPARKEAEQAVRLDPKNARAHLKLGWVLEHDSFGQRFGPGWNQPAAIHEYEQAVSLDPKDEDAHASLAILVEHDAMGVRYASGLSLDRSIREYRLLHDELKTDSYNGNLLIDLAKSGRYGDVSQVAGSLKQDAQRDALWVAAEAKLHGAQAALAQAQKLSPDPEVQRNTLKTAGGLLVLYREYPTAAALIEQAANGADEAGALRAQAAALAKVRRWDVQQLSGQDPVALVRRVFAALFLPDPPARFTDLFVKPVRDAMAKSQDAALVKGMIQGVKAQASLSKLPPETLLDITLSTLDLHQDGDPKFALRVRATVSNHGGREMHWYVAPEGRGYALVAGSAARGEEMGTAELGGQALEALHAGDLAAAKQWLSWESTEAGEVNERNARAAFVDLWAQAQRDPAKLELAAATAAVGGSRSEAAIPIVLAARKQATGAMASKLDHALAMGYAGLQRFPELAQVSSKFLDEPNSDGDFATFALARTQIDRLDRDGVLEAAAKARLTKNPDDRAAHATLMELAYVRGQYADGMKQAQAMIADGRADATVYNQRAWFGLIGPVGEAELDAARKASEMTGGKSDGIVNTLAAVEAALGHVREAEEYLRQELQLRPDHTPVPSDWWIHGRMAEALGLPEVARADYARAAEGTEKTKDPFVGILVKQRLSRLGAAVVKPR